MKKRLLSILLILCMMLTWLPATASATGESATAQSGDATFTLSVTNASCADGHPGEIVGIPDLTVDTSKWAAEKTITVQYSIQFRCTTPDCALYSADSYYLREGQYTFANVDKKLCHRAFSDSFVDTFNTEYETDRYKSFSVHFTPELG